MRCPEHTGCKSAASGFSRPRNSVTCGCSKPEKGRQRAASISTPLVQRYSIGSPLWRWAGASRRGEEGRASAFDRHGADSPTSPRTGSRSTISAASSISSPISAMARRISRAACAVAPSTPGVWRRFSKPTSENSSAGRAGAVHFNTFAIHGRGLSRYNLNNILTASDIEALSTVRLSELWYEHQSLPAFLLTAPSAGRELPALIFQAAAQPIRSPRRARG
jgi:hypothetical protein